MVMRIAIFSLLCGCIPITSFYVLAGEDPVVAVVNGTEIHFSQAQAAHKRLPKDYQRVSSEKILPRLVDSLVDTHLAATKARQEKIHETEEFNSQMVWIENQVLQRLMLGKIMEGAVDYAALRTLYDKEVKKLATSKQIQASHILLKTEKEAKDVIAMLVKGSEFAELARRRSSGPSASDGGNLGFFSRGQMVPEFENAVYKLKPGAFTRKAVKTQFGWHVIKAGEQKSAKVPSFELMESKLRNSLLQETLEAFIKELRKGAKITLFNLDGTLREQLDNLN